ncbi:MAG: hypothetical protein R2705_13840 [Ilumatobacteraceae bacterium]
MSSGSNFGSFHEAAQRPHVGQERPDAARPQRGKVGALHSLQGRDQ